MKKYIKILIPISTTLIPISIVSCSKKSTSFPKNYLDIKTDEEGNKFLAGFNQNHQRAYQVEDYDTLTIPKEVTYLEDQSFTPNISNEAEYDAPNAIKTINFEKDCQCGRFGRPNFNFCQNLETVIFPPLYGGNDRYMFDKCTKLSTFDLSNITVLIHDIDHDFLPPNVDFFPDNGKIIVKKNQTNVSVLANNMFNKLKNKGWTIIEK